MNKLPENIVVIDLETSGLDPKTCGILEIGAVKSDGQRFYKRVALDRGRRVESGALECNGIDPLDLVIGKSCNYALRLFDDWLGDGATWIMVGKNPQFDYGFLQANWPDMLHRKLSDVISRRTVDLHSIVYSVALKRGVDLAAGDFTIDDLYCDLINMNPEPDPHNALRGALYEMECFRRLVFREKAWMPQNDFEQLMLKVDREYLQKV